MHFATQMKASHFGVKRSKFKVTVGMKMCWKKLFGVDFQLSSYRGRNDLNLIY